MTNRTLFLQASPKIKKRQRKIADIYRRCKPAAVGVFSSAIAQLLKLILQSIYRYLDEPYLPHKVT
jgi:hypothetical protein